MRNRGQYDCTFDDVQHTSSKVQAKAGIDAGVAFIYGYNLQLNSEKGKMNEAFQEPGDWRY